ncbi:MAG: aldehyde dehydrogenase family protein, partial [Candidatus Nanopelagicales bacterium]|nr:aldehyde dehydrogenase family protein [Candidatus Nanopelagicales bacterium]
MTTVISPVTGVQIADIDPTPVEEVDALIARAHDAFPAWRAVSPGDRARLLRRFSQVVEDHIEELAQLEVANSGHTIGNARWEAGNVRDVLAYYA